MTQRKLRKAEIFIIGNQQTSQKEISKIVVEVPLVKTGFHSSIQGIMGLFINKHGRLQILVIILHNV